ncbi:MAG: hypothetical protein SOY07_08880 [Bacteroidales bacterium]|nr:hypothetical protein [Bacteroidales bacterium]
MCKITEYVYTDGNLVSAEDVYKATTAETVYHFGEIIKQLRSLQEKGVLRIKRNEFPELSYVLRGTEETEFVVKMQDPTVI